MRTTPHRTLDHRSKLFRLYNLETKRYLHLSGSGEVPSTHYAWVGFEHQAEALRSRAGEDFPYILAPLDHDRYHNRREFSFETPNIP